MAKHDGGPAFPRVSLKQTGNVARDNDLCFEDSGAEGMTLLDYFAAHATTDDICAYMRTDYPDGSMEKAYTREEAKYAYADAMLRARRKRQ